MRKVITYGTFDLLHAGHINLLRRAKELGDYLIVVVSTDEFNWNEKQKKWPVRRIILFAVLVLVVCLGVAAYVFRDSLNLDAARRFVRYLNVSGGGTDGQFLFDAGNANQYADLQGGLAVASVSGLSLYDANGDELAVVQCRAVAHGHRARHGDDRLVHDDGEDTLIHGIFREDAVYVGVDEIRRRDYVQSGVHGIGFCSAVHLVHHYELGVFGVGRSEQTLERCAVHLLHVVERHLHKVEGVDEQFEGLVLTAVVDDAHLELRVVHIEQRAHVVDDGLLLVVGRSHNRDARHVGCALHHVAYIVVRPTLVARAIAVGEDE